MKKLLMLLPGLLILVGCGMYNTRPMYIGGFNEETKWIDSEGRYCGTVRIEDGIWVAYAFEDMSRDHYFETNAKAVKWLTDNWCKP